MNEPDWALIEPYLRNDERLFEISVDDLLNVDLTKRSPSEVYRKAEVLDAGVLQDGENR